MKPITKTEPYVLTSDNDGHWYFLPESLAARFEELSELGDAYEEDMDEKILFAWDEMQQYQIDSPYVLRITQWLPY